MHVKIILWNKYFVEVTDSLVGDYTLSILYKNKADGFEWVLTDVYGPNKPCERKIFWEELDNNCRMWNLPWCMSGDFNAVSKCAEKKGCTKISRIMKCFNKFISSHDLIDLPLKGAGFTWSNGQANPIMSRLGRFLISPSFEAHYPFISQLAKARPTSDHIPILLDISDPSWGPNPFRFEIMWFLENGFINMLEEWWSSFCFAGSPSTIFWCKLKALKEKLKEWNMDTFGHTTSRLEKILSDILDLESIAEEDELSSEQLNEKLLHTVEFEKVTQMEEVAWKARSKSEWLTEGDRNTHFFMSKATSRRRHNRIKQLYIDGNLEDDKVKLQHHIVDFYKNLFKEEEVIRPELQDIDFDTINTLESGILDANFSEDEVLHAIKALGQDKASGPDGYPLMFFSK
ncbi:uncharacterized protein LOC113336798 [Papaver somniferum]|uniref:uncharacterized protein LOC113336798 n=1 Tax=Papaver somniferum TaxID=3469 RepID=UPI000E6F715F|nr:uncharacterized protein LOC113336798 [Papaver somniferum]